MNDGKVHDTPSEVETDAGVVLVNGPDGVAVSMTPEAAAKTGARLLDAAAEAEGEVEFEADRQRRKARQSESGGSASARS